MRTPPQHKCRGMHVRSRVYSSVSLKKTQLESRDNLAVELLAKVLLIGVPRKESAKGLH